MFNCGPDVSVCLPEMSVLGVMCFGFVLGWMLYFVNRYRKDVALTDLGTIGTALAGATILGFLDAGGAVKNATLIGAYGLGIFLGFMAYGYTLYRLVKAHPEAYDLLWFVDGRRKQDGETGYRMPEVSDLTNRPMTVETQTLKRKFRGLPPAPVTGGFQPLSSNNQVEYKAAIESLENAINEVADAIARESDNAARDALHDKENKLFVLLGEMRDRHLLNRLSSPEVAAALAQIDAATARLNGEASKLAGAGAKLTQVAEIVAAATDLGGKVKAAFA